MMEETIRSDTSTDGATANEPFMDEGGQASKGNKGQANRNDKASSKKVETLSVDFDSILPHVGEMGIYQMGLFLLMCIPACLPAAFLAFNQVFLSASPDHWCKVSELNQYNLTEDHAKNLSIPINDKTGEYRKCQQYDVNFTEIYELNGQKWPADPDPDWNLTSCKEGWIYDRSEYKDSLVTEHDLVCDKKWWPSTSTMLFYVGSLFGNILFGFIADKFGRRTSFFSLLFMEVSVSIITCFSPTYTAFTVLRTLNGVTFPALFQIPFILCLETMGPAYRTFAGMMICLFFAVALMILAGVAYIFNSWQDLAYVSSFPFIVLFSYWWFVPESPRWLLSYAKVDEAEVIVQNIARWNKKDISPTFVHDFVEQQKEEQAHKLATLNKKPAAAKHNPSMWVLLLYYPVARRNFFIITFNWLTNALVYNGLTFYSADLGVSSHLGFFISSAVEIPSYFMGWYVMDKWGRRWCLFLTMMTGGISCVSCLFVPQGASPWYTVTLAMIGKFQIAASFGVIYVYAGELMPTVVRSEAMGISSFVAGIGMLFFPYINALGNYSHVLPLVIMGTLSAVGGIAALFLPETLWKHLPNTLEEGEEFGSKFKICSCPQEDVTLVCNDEVNEGEVNEETVSLYDRRNQQPNGKVDQLTRRFSEMA